MLLSGCYRGSVDSQAIVDRSRASKVYTETELNNLITRGMSIADVTNKFGLPGSAVKVSEDTILLTYMFPFEARQEQGPYLTGFSIDIKGGQVASWSPVTGMTGTTIKAGGSQASFGDQSFQIFLASGGLTNVANAVDSDGIADGSDLKAVPDLAFKAKVFAGRSGNEHPGEQTVILVVTEQDASKLKDLSENNSGKRLLIVCRSRVIAAPVISAPLASRELMFTVKNPSVLSSIQGK